MKENIMNTFVNAISEQEARTENGMKARATTANACVDLFFIIGASRGKNIIPQFTAAFVENDDLALRIVAWARDIRGGAGEREIFRQVLTHLETANPDAAVALMNKVPELGRFDDLLVFKTKQMKSKAYTLLGDYLRAGNQLAGKWTPRKGPIAAEIREFFGMSPKQYRKTLVGLTNVVETQMCAQKWDEINYSHVPSVAHSRYKKAFGKHGTTYAEYITKLVKGDDPTVKINAAAIFPHDVLKGRIDAGYVTVWDKQELDVIEAQWAALPNYVGGASVLPLVDVSGSMTCSAGGKGTTTCLEVAVSLGLYFADKNKGAFKDCMLTFSSSPKLVQLKGSINQKIDQMVKTEWEMSTNLHAAFDAILTTAVKNSVAAADMPETLILFSDMQFNACVDHDDSAMEMIERKYKEAGYTVPSIIFWNLNAGNNVPVKFDKSGAALVSGFSPAVASAILSGNTDVFTPESIMLQAVMKDRYSV
jgi:hypothetical protein